MNLLPILEEEFRQNLQDNLSSIQRKYAFPVAKEAIKVAIGMRRCGKTTFFFQTIQKLVQDGVPIERVLHINFEDDRLQPLDYKGMGKLIDDWYTLHPKNHDHCCYLFLDEVQNVENWDLVLRRLQDSKNVQIYVTGSSAKLLSTEIATSLRGRSLSIEIFPFSYGEFLETHKLPFPSLPFGKKVQDQQKMYLQDYFKLGGFPAVQTLPLKERLETLQNYVETVIFRDIVERNKVDNIALLKYLIHFLLKNVSAPFSINKFYNDIKSQGYKVGKDTLYAYIGYIEDAFLIFTVPVFTESLRHSQIALKKVYAIDNGLVAANTFNLNDNFGKNLENQVYLDLRRQGKKIFYYKTSDNYEIDFITQDIYGKFEIIQVAWEEDDPQVLEREQRALRQAEKELGFPGKLISATSYLRDFTSH